MTKVPKLSKHAEENIIAQALGIIGQRLAKAKTLLDKTELVNNYLVLKLAHLENEVFGVLFLDIKFKLIKDQTMFHGTLDTTVVYPREIVKAALACNAARIILYHNHPSGDVTPSGGDMLLTKNLKTVLTSVDIVLLDHVIVAGDKTFSFAIGKLI